MQTIVSHTLVKNGQPFIGLVLRQALPYVQRSLITVSEKSDDDTLTILRQLQKEYPEKIEISFERVSCVGELTNERQKQVDKSYEDWIWFLDDDDYWPEESIKKVLELIEENKYDGLGMMPYQLIDEKYCDWSWRHMRFTKFFKNKDINYRGDWPLDLIYKGDTMLYWKTNTMVLRTYIPFLHLSYVKNGSWRIDENVSKRFKHKIGKKREVPEELRHSVAEVFTELYKDKLRDGHSR